MLVTSMTGKRRVVGCCSKSSGADASGVGGSDW